MKNSHPQAETTYPRLEREYWDSGKALFPMERKKECVKMYFHESVRTEAGKTCWCMQLPA